MRRFNHRVAGSVALFGFVQIALGHVPNYKNFQLQVRSNLCANEPQGYNLPCDVFFNSATPAINDAGQQCQRPAHGDQQLGMRSERVCE